MTDRDHFAAAVLSAIMDEDTLMSVYNKARLCECAYVWADAMLEHRAKEAGEQWRITPPTAPACTAADQRRRRWESLGPSLWGAGVAEDIEEIVRHQAVAMNWISEATSILMSLLDRAGMDGGKSILSRACIDGWDSKPAPEKEDKNNKWRFCSKPD